MSWAAICIIALGWLLSGSWLVWQVISARKHMRRFKSWANRDAELLSRWYTAYFEGDYEDAERLRYAMRKNWEAYREP